MSEGRQQLGVDAHQLAFPPLVIHIFWPLTTYSSPIFSARVFSPATSEPAPGSVTQYACGGETRSVTPLNVKQKKTHPNLNFLMLPKLKSHYFGFYQTAGSGRKQSHFCMLWKLPPYFYFKIALNFDFVLTPRLTRSIILHHKLKYKSSFLHIFQILSVELSYILFSFKKHALFVLR